MGDGGLLSLPEAARRLGLSHHTMRAWVRQRRVPFVRLGRRVLLDPRDVQRFIDANRVKEVSFDRRD
jgi:excisionase family DNA binding protein